MASYLCGCAPIEPDHSLIDMDLEELWEKQTNGRSNMKMKKGLRGRGKERSSKFRSLSRGRRSMSRGRGMSERGKQIDMLVRDDDEDYEIEDERRPGMSSKRFSKRGKDNNKKVSISKYVEKIELQQRQPRPSSVRRRRTTVTAKREVSRTHGLSNRSRSFDSATRGIRGVFLTRSRSMDSRGSRGGSRGRGILRRTNSADRGNRSMSRTRSKNRFDFPDYDSEYDYY